MMKTSVARLWTLSIVCTLLPRDGLSASLSTSKMMPEASAIMGHPKVFLQPGPAGGSQHHRRQKEEFSVVRQLQQPSPPIEGHPSCRCASPSDLVAISEHNFLPGSPFRDANLETFGFGCQAHEEDLDVCNFDTECSGTDGVCQSRPSWCGREWCWVLPSQCALVHRLYPDLVNTTFQQTRFYSYATCWGEDTKQSDALLNALENKTLRMGFLHQIGGYGGAYNVDRTSHQGPLENWYGAIAFYVREAARQGKFNINITEPPAFLFNRSREFGTGPYDLCVYATALGYLDACVAVFIVTNLRVTFSDWMVLGSEPIRLITPIIVEDVEESNSYLNSRYTKTLFLPLTPQCWIFIIAFVVPIMATMFLFHDYGEAGSRFPSEERLFYSGPQSRGQTKADDEHNMEIQDRHIPAWSYIPRVIYIAALGIFAREYTYPIISPGAKIHLIGWCFFILTLLSVYTANLAAILAVKHSNVPVRSLEEAVQQRKRICALRQVYEIVSTIHGIPDQAFARDPIEIGGDGKPGFLCCSAIQRVMSFIDPAKADKDPRYCHVGLGFEQDVTTFHGFGLACNVHMVGETVGSIQYGFPLAARYSDPLQALMIRMKNDGWLERVRSLAAPPSRCETKIKVQTEDGEEYAFTIEELSGIWVVTGMFAFAGLASTLYSRIAAFSRKSRSRGRFKPVLRYDQYGERINRLEEEEEIDLQQAVSRIKPSRRFQSFFGRKKTTV